MNHQPSRMAMYFTAALGVLGAVSPASAASVNLTPSKDNTLYANDGGLSNGQGEFLFSGLTVSFGSRRAVLAFDVANAIPAGSTVSSATLTLHASLTISSPPKEFYLHRIVSDWGEGASNAGTPGGAGAAAEPGDATWTHAFYPGTLWSAPGGDFDAGSSSRQSLEGADAFYTWGPTSTMTADVQGWLDTPGSNYGWILIGEEDVVSAYRFESGESTSGLQPVLTVDFTPPLVPAGSVPDGDQVPGSPLTVAKVGVNSLLVTWAASCNTPSDTDYELYEGVMGSFASHTPTLCSTSGATTATIITPGPGSRYYLAVPRNATTEGSYGKDSGGVERPQGPSSCLPRAIVPCM